MHEFAAVQLSTVPGEPEIVAEMVDRVGFPVMLKKSAVRISVGTSASAMLVLVTTTRRLPATVSNWADAA